jgi:hypothetical protein
MGLIFHLVWVAVVAAVFTLLFASRAPTPGPFCPGGFNKVPFDWGVTACLDLGAILSAMSAFGLA